MYDVSLEICFIRVHSAITVRTIVTQGYVRATVTDCASYIDNRHEPFHENARDVTNASVDLVSSHRFLCTGMMIQLIQFTSLYPNCLMAISDIIQLNRISCFQVRRNV